MLQDKELCFESILNEQIKAMGMCDVKLHTYDKNNNLITFDFEYDFYDKIKDMLLLGVDFNVIFFDDIGKDNNDKKVVDKETVLGKLNSLEPKYKTLYESTINMVYD